MVTRERITTLPTYYIAVVVIKCRKREGKEEKFCSSSEGDAGGRRTDDTTNDR